MTDSPFPPFALPQTPSPSTAPEEPGGVLARNAEGKVIRARKPKPRKTKAETPKVHAMTSAAVEPTAPEKPARKKRGPNKAKGARSPKFDLQTILSAASMLKEADMPAFEKMIALLQDAGKAGRARLLEALGKVFG